MRRAQRLGRLAAVTQLVFAAVLGGFASLHWEASVIPRGAVILGVFALPGLVGWIGANARRPGLVAAAAVTSGLGAFIAFSGVTLMFLLPAAMFLASALPLAIPAPGEPRGGLSSGAGQLVLAAAICALIVGSGASALLVTDEACWAAHQTPTGTWIEVLPYSTGEMTVGGGDVTSGGCSSGLISLRGAGLGLALGATALGLAIIGSRRRVGQAPDPPESEAASQV